MRLDARLVLLRRLLDLELLFEKLPAVHLGVEAPVLEQFAVRPALDDATVDDSGSFPRPRTRMEELGQD